MKRILCSILIFCTMLILTSCSSEPVEFSEKLFKNRECYIDVVEITPVSSVDDSFDIYCKCTLQSGDTVWMEASYDDYVKMIDNEVNNAYFTDYSEESKMDLAYTAKRITYDEPVRLEGKVAVTSNDLGDYNDKGNNKVFHLVTVGENVLKAPSTKTSTAVQYTKDVKENTVVYADISSVSPQYVIEPVRKNVVCKCTVSGGDNCQMMISTEDYRKYFDSSASFSVISNYKESVDFSSSIKISGVTVSADDIIGSSAYSSDDSGMLIYFKEIDEEQIAAEKEEENVSYSITRIDPKYTNDYGSVVVCECTDDSGDKVLMRISSGKYKENFDPDFAYSTYDKLTDSAKAKVIEYDSPVTISGVTVKRSDILPEHLIKDDTPEKAFDFKEKE